MELELSDMFYMDEIPKHSISPANTFWRLLKLAHVLQNATMHKFQIARHSKSMKAYEILTEYFWGLQSEVALWEFDIPSCSTQHKSANPTMPINISSSSLSLLALLLWANPFQCFCTLIAATSGSIEGAPTDNIKGYLPWTGDPDWHEMWDWYVSEIR